MITYNHERFIAQALESVLSQHVNFGYEIVVGEDCSTDTTRRILMDFRRRNPDRIVPLLRERNLGALPNLKESLNVCGGEYVALLEGDDYWTDPTKLQKQVDFLDRHPDFKICSSRAQLIDETGQGLSRVYPTIPAGSYTISDLFEANWIVTCTAVYKRDAMPSMPDWWLKLRMGDWPLHIMAAANGKIHLMNEITSVYRIHGGGIWSSLSSVDRLRATVEMLKSIDKYLGFRYTANIRPILARCEFELAGLARLAGHRVEASKQLASCLWHGGGKLPVARRQLASLGAYALIGSWYRVFSRAKSLNGDSC